ncbi:hypothetical protein Barb7_01232 [Bacteroidales bacterium Barb7]|nr:hypothetical protein Barb7_01232 [Bacteroidales bacterium Barb7]
MLGFAAEFLRVCFIARKCTGEGLNKKGNTYICAVYRFFQRRMEEKNDTGREGEEAAKAFLIKKGYKILHTNWHWHHFELDITAVDEDMLVVAEVKTRTDDFLISPEEAVNRKKINRLVAAADGYVNYFNINLPVRFDIITVIKSKQGYSVVEHIVDAFFAPVR